MKFNLSTALSLLTASIVATACAASPAPDPGEPTNEEGAVGEGKADGLKADNWTYYSVRSDFRKCMWPICGGYFVKRVNQPKTKCLDGTWQKECYVAQVDWSALGLSDSESAELSPGAMVLRGSITKGQQGNQTYAVFAATEGWQAATDQAASGTFYRAKDSGIVCITFPCPTIEGTQLNRNKKPTATYAGLDLSPSGASQDQLDAGWKELESDNGLIVAAKTESVTGPAGKADGLSASQFYTRVQHQAASCHKSGCSGELCVPADQNVFSTCIWKAEYACYQQATCEPQADGACGFTPSAELDACLKSAGTL